MRERGMEVGSVTSHTLWHSPINRIRTVHPPRKKPHHRQWLDPQYSTAQVFIDWELMQCLHNFEYLDVHYDYALKLILWKPLVWDKSGIVDSIVIIMLAPPPQKKSITLFQPI